MSDVLEQKSRLPLIYALVAMILVAVALRPGIVSVGPVLIAMIADFQLSHSMASMLTTIPDLLMGLLALPTPWLASRYGRNPVLLLALLLLGVSILLRALVTTVPGLLLTTAGVGAGVAIAGALMAGYIKGRFPHNTAQVMGIYAMALSLGSTLSAAATGPMAAQADAGWRLGTGIWALFAILGLLAWGGLSYQAAHRHQPVAAVTRLPWRNSTAWRVALFFAADNFLFYALLAWTAPMYLESGLGNTQAGFVLATYTAVFMLSNPVLGALSQSLDRRRWLALCAGLALSGLTWLAIVPMAAPFLAIALCAFGLGGAFTLGMTLPLDNTQTVGETNAWNAFALTIGYLIAALGPLSVGYLRDLTQDFQASRWLLVVIAAGMLLLTPLLKPVQPSPAGSPLITP